MHERQGGEDEGVKTFGVFHGIYEVAVRNIRGISEWLAAYASICPWVNVLPWRDVSSLSLLIAVDFLYVANSHAQTASCNWFRTIRTDAKIFDSLLSSS